MARLAWTVGTGWGRRSSRGPSASDAFSAGLVQKFKYREFWINGKLKCGKKRLSLFKDK